MLNEEEIKAAIVRKAKELLKKGGTTVSIASLMRFMGWRGHC